MAVNEMKVVHPKAEKAKAKAVKAKKNDGRFADIKARSVKAAKPEKVRFTALLDEDVAVKLTEMANACDISKTEFVSILIQREHEGAQS